MATQAVFLSNAPESTTVISLTKDLAKILHDTPFTSFGDRLNFQVFLHRKRGNRQRGHKGSGLLTLPSDAIVDLFLSIYEPTYRPALPCDYYGARYKLKFMRSRTPPDAGIVKLVQQTPYVDPQIHLEQAERAEKLQDFVQVSSVQLGWRCRDDAFSIEWNSSTDLSQTEGQVLNGITVEFADDSRELWISLPSPTSVTPTTPMHDLSFLIASLTSTQSTLNIGFRWNRVQRLDFENEHGTRPAIVFDLYRPPSFELRKSHVGLYDNDRTSRMPLSFLPGAHQRVAPYASLVVRVECGSLQDFQKFKSMSTAAHLPSPTYIYTTPVQRQLFSQIALDRFDIWVAGLEWPIAFQLVAIRDHLYADPIELWELKGQVASLEQEHGVAKTSEILRLFRTRLLTLSWDGEDERGATTVPECLSRAENDVSELHMSLRDQSNNPGYFNCYHVTVTPTRIIPEGPYPDQSNRVLRRYAEHTDCFLRVAFTDEDSLSFRWDWGVEGAAFVHTRVGGILKGGLIIAGREYEFLHFSQSALKEHAVWFCRAFVEADGKVVTAETIRQSLGDFRHLERQPARMAARVSQAFTATEPSVTLEVEEIFTIPDIEREGSCFTDGIGDISPDMAAQIAQSLQSRLGNRRRFYVTPSAYQFRMGGYKGVLAVDYTLRGMEVRLRKSQSKFNSPGAQQIEIAQAFFKPKPVHLNRNLIMILETLGVPARAFIKLQDEAVDDIELAAQSLRECASLLLDAHGCGTSFRLSSVFYSLSKLGIGLQEEAPASLHVLKDDFIDRAIEFAVNHVLRVIKHKARIPVKGSYTLVGVADIHGYLKPNEVFVCIKERDKRTVWLEGNLLVTRSPQAHPGDVQFVHAIGQPPADSPFTPDRNPRHNSIVFSTNGDRSVPSMLAGGDLDGDEFNIIRNSDLWPPACDPPAGYPPAIIKTLNRPCDVNDIADWVAEYINSNILGMISNELLIRADQSYNNEPTTRMAREPGCLKLAELASAAVDFAKSGTPVDKSNLPPALFHKSYKPDWAIGEMGPAKSGQMTYESQTAIGKLFRRIDLSDVDRLADLQARREHNPPRAKPKKKKARRELDELVRDMDRLNVAGAIGTSDDPVSFAVRNRLRRYIDIDSPIPTEMTNIASEQFEAYATELRYICGSNTLSYKPLTEEEVLVGTIATKTSQPRRRQDRMTQLRTQSDELVKRILAELAGEGPREGGGNRRRTARTSRDTETDLEDVLLRGWSAWKLSVLKCNTEDGHGFGAKTFGIIALVSIFDCLRELDERERLAGGITT
ncbi:hypothetical protein FRB94_013733 [Tulasnella sp. JGI-2019a]|nr:hypothetical protein FRB94_013733 [Tulasnella sp. JGI-2019a]